MGMLMLCGEFVPESDMRWIILGSEVRVEMDGNLVLELDHHRVHERVKETAGAT
jgi:hypothetical protein